MTLSQNFSVLLQKARQTKLTSMPVAIHATEKAISKIFCNDFVFSIPTYQRPYAWKIEQASELLADLLSFLGDGAESITDANPYFLGSIVLIKSEDSTEADVVDGQQRLTTLTILLSVLRGLEGLETNAEITGISGITGSIYRKGSKLPNAEERYELQLREKLKEKEKRGLEDLGNNSEITDYIYQRGSRLANTENRYRLKLREKDEKFFRQYIQDGNKLNDLLNLDTSQLTDSQQKIQINANYFLKKLGLFSKKKRERFTSYLIMRCFLVVVSTPNLDSAYRIFSVLNSRGMNLSVTDILKSEIIGAIPSSQREQYTKIWEDEEEDLGRETFLELFAHIRMISRKAKMRDTTLAEFRNYIKPQKQPQEFIDNIVKPYSDALEIIKKANYSSGHPDAKTVNFLFQWLNKIDNFDWIPPAILYLSKNDNNADKLKHFFTHLERLASGLMIARADINDRISRYAKLLVEIEKGSDLYESNSPLQLTSSEIDQIVKTLDGDLYLIKRISKYVLLRLDSALTKVDVIFDHPVITIEHVLPQNPQEGSVWDTWFPSKEEQIKYVHRLGNLALLSHKKNAGAQNYDFEKKKAIYFTTRDGACAFTLTTQVLQQSEWTPKVINQRQVSNLQVLKDLWRL